MLDLLRVIIALAFTIGLMLVLAFGVRRLGLLDGSVGDQFRAFLKRIEGRWPKLAAWLKVEGGDAPVRLPKRLAIKEQLWLDAGRTRLLLVGCDNVETLLLITPTTTTILPHQGAVPSLSTPTQDMPDV